MRRLKKSSPFPLSMTRHSLAMTLHVRIHTSKEFPMWMKIVAGTLILTLPGSVSAGPIMSAAEKAVRGLAQPRVERETHRGRFWTAIALIAGGGVLATLGAMEIGDDDDDDIDDDLEDADDSDDGEDADGWGNQALLGGGIAAAAVGGVILLRTRSANASVSVRSNTVTLRHTIRF
jgi:hypothetical protein